MKTIQHLSLLFFVLLLAAGCGKKNRESNNTYEIALLKKSFLAASDLAATQHESAMFDLNLALLTFTQGPSTPKLGEARDKWRTSRRYFHLLQLFKRMQGDIVNPLDYDESKIETPDMNPGYVDSVNGDPLGIITDPVNFPTIQEVNLILWHQGVGGNKTLGYQVIEFLLWGEDTNPSGPGGRVAFDFNENDPIRSRRRSFLSFITVLMGLELNKNFFSATFEERVLLAENEPFLTFVLRGVVDYIEQDLVTRALRKPYVSQDQKDEISVFADNSIIEINAMLEALDLVLDGRNFFSEHNDMFLIDFIRFVDSEKAESIENSLATAQAAITSINGAFDNAISNAAERPKILQAMTELSNVATELRTFSEEYGLDL